MNARHPIAYQTRRPDQVLPGPVVEAIRGQAHLLKYLCDWLDDRSKTLIELEDQAGSFKDDAANHLHVRAFKGARYDCADIRQQMHDTLFPQPTTHKP